MQNLLRRRVQNQQLTGSDFSTGAELVHWFGAIQG